MTDKDFEISPKVYARMGGLAYLIIIVTGAMGEIFIRSKIIVPGDDIKTTQNIAAAPLLWRIGIAGDLVMHVFDLVVGVVYYTLFKRVNKTLALLSLLFGLIQTAVLVANKMNLMMPLFLLENANYSKAFTVQQLQALNSLFVKAHDYGFGFGLIFFGFECLIDGYLIFKSEFLPRILGILIFITGLCYLTNTFLLIFSPGLEGFLFPILLGPVAFIGEFSMCLWLLIKGVNVKKWKERIPIKPLICIAFVLSGIGANAQVSFVQNTIDKIEGYKNLSYQSVSRQKELFTSDTITEQHKASFVKAPADNNFGYLFNIATLNENNKSTYTDLYNGQNLLHIIPEDSTYEMQKIQSFNIQGTLPGCLRWIRSRLEKGSSKIVKTNDTTINTIDSYHLIATVYDTIINKEHNYTTVHLFIDKLSGIPDCIIVLSRNTTFGDGISTYYSETHYLDYKFNQTTIDIASMTIPTGFHLPKRQPVLPKEQTGLLAVGSAAPDWSLYAEDGKKMSLTQMKGKVILLDFFFIGCGGCMLSLKPLNKIHEKYKNENVAMVSMTFRDSKKSATEFKTNYNIKYPIYINAGDVVKSYHVEAFPTFYFIDKEGKIANITVGYSEDFEEKITSTIADLLKK